MDLKTNIETNKKIMALIKSNHPDEFPLAHHTPESRYYELLDKENSIAERHLETCKEK